MNNERELSLSVKFTLKTVLFVIGNNKKVDDQTEKGGSSTFSGGGEPRLKMVMKGAEFEEIDCSILSEFLTTLPRTAVHVPNPTFKISVIGRRMLTYCSTFGAEE